jgi:hypothetical protein
LSVNNLLIQPGQDATYNYNYASGDINKGSPLFGTKVLITIHGMDETDTVSSSIYVPKQLTDMITEYPDSLSANQGLQLRWTPDDANTWGNVTIQHFITAA